MVLIRALPLEWYDQDIPKDTSIDGEFKETVMISDAIVFVTLTGISYFNCIVHVLLILYALRS